MRDETAVFPSLFVVEAFVAYNILRWKPACQMEEVPGHGIYRRSDVPNKEPAGEGAFTDELQENGRSAKPSKSQCLPVHCVAN